MNTRTLLASATGFAVLGMVSLGAWAQSKHEEHVMLDKVPAAVKATILRETAGGEIKEIDAETHRGKTHYDVEFVRAGQTIEIAIAPNGTLLSSSADEDTEEEAEQDDDAQERSVKEAEVPAAALATLKKLAGDAPLTHFAEEIERGSRLYEGTWKMAAGSTVDALVTPTGELVELEEAVAADQVPAAVLAAARKKAGADGTLVCEKKTLILYEVKSRQGDKQHETLYTADGRVFQKDVDQDDED